MSSIIIVVSDLLVLNKSALCSLYVAARSSEEPTAVARKEDCDLSLSEDPWCSCQCQAGALGSSVKSRKYEHATITNNKSLLEVKKS